jgi:hypothetical protein
MLLLVGETPVWQLSLLRGKFIVDEILEETHCKWNSGGLNPESL